jgi:very-short-patch-repair endonuclease
MTPLKDRAKALRRNSTVAEKKLWSLLRKRQQCGYKFRRQAPLGDFVVDFVCFEAKLIIDKIRNKLPD